MVRRVIPKQHRGSLQVLIMFSGSNNEWAFKIETEDFFCFGSTTDQGVGSPRAMTTIPAIHVF